VLPSTSKAAWTVFMGGIILVSLTYCTFSMFHQFEFHIHIILDWACGGQFNRCFEFVQLLAMTFKSAQIDVVVFFDGTLKENKKMRMERNDIRQRTISVC
jgi:hypothetical protein